MVNDLILTDSDEITFEAHVDSNSEIYFIMHNNSDNTSIMDYQELTISINRGQAHLLMLYLQEKLK